MYTVKHLRREKDWYADDTNSVHTVEGR